MQLASHSAVPAMTPAASDLDAAAIQAAEAAAVQAAAEAAAAPAAAEGAAPTCHRQRQWKLHAWFSDTNPVRHGHQAC